MGFYDQKKSCIVNLSLQNFRQINVTKLGDELRSTRSIDIMAYSASLKIRRENYIENFDEQENKETKSAK